MSFVKICNVAVSLLSISGLKVTWLFEEFDKIRVVLYLFLDALQKEKKKFSGRTGKFRPGMAKFLLKENVGINNNNRY